MRAKYEELSEEVGGLEEEWKKYKEVFLGAAEELCGRTSGKGGVSKNSNQGGRQARLQRQYAQRRKPGKKLRRPNRGNQPGARIDTYGQKKTAAKRAVDKARRDI